MIYTQKYLKVDLNNFTHALQSSYIARIVAKKLPNIPNLRSLSINASCQTLSYAFRKSIKHKYNLKNQDSGKVLYLEKQEYVDSCGTHVFR